MLPTILVHGFGFNLNGRNPHKGVYKEWKKEIPGETIEFSWYSIPPGIKNVLRSWIKGSLTRYGLAWKMAAKAALSLAVTIEKTGHCNILCHSLGSRVVIQALKTMPLNVHRVLILNGAEMVDEAKSVAILNPHILFYNVVVREDDVLHKARLFAPFQSGSSGALVCAK